MTTLDKVTNMEDDNVEGKDPHMLAVPSNRSSPKKEFVCTICKKVFSHKGNCRQHIRSHTKEQPFSCNICGMSYSKSSHLLEHRRRHNNLPSLERKQSQKQYTCSICERTLLSLNSLKVHMRSHSKECTLSCNHCDRMFRHKSSLERHLKVHAGIKLYACDFCERSFYDKSDMKKHIKLHIESKKRRNVFSSNRKHFNSLSSLKSQDNKLKYNVMDESSDQLELLDSADNFAETGNATNESDHGTDDYSNMENEGQLLVTNEDFDRIPDHVISDDCNMENEGQSLNTNEEGNRSPQKEIKVQLKTEADSIEEFVTEGNLPYLHVDTISMTGSFAKDLQNDQPIVAVEKDEIASYDSQMYLLQKEKNNVEPHTDQNDNRFDENIIFKTDTPLELKENLTFPEYREGILDTSDRLDNFMSKNADMRKNGDSVEISDEIKAIKVISNVLQEDILRRRKTVEDEMNVFISNGNKNNVVHNAYTKEKELVTPFTEEDVENALKDQEICNAVIGNNCISDVISMEINNKNRKKLCVRDDLKSDDTCGNIISNIQSSVKDKDYELQLESKVVQAVVTNSSKDPKEIAESGLTVEFSEDKTEGNDKAKVSQKNKDVSPNELEYLTKAYWRTNKDNTVAQLDKKVFKICRKMKNNASNEDHYISKYFVIEPRLLKRKCVSSYEEALRKDKLYLGTRLNTKPNKHTVSESGIEPEKKMIKTERLTSQSDSELLNLAEYVPEQCSESELNLNKIPDIITIDDDEQEEDENLSNKLPDRKTLKLPPEKTRSEESPSQHSDKPLCLSENSNDLAELPDRKAFKLLPEITSSEESPSLHSDKPLPVSENANDLRKSDFILIKPLVNSYEENMTEDTTKRNLISGNISKMNTMTGNMKDINDMAGNVTKANYMPGNVADKSSLIETTTVTYSMPKNRTNMDTMTGIMTGMNNLTGSEAYMTGNKTNLNIMPGNVADINNMNGNNTYTNNLSGNITDFNTMTRNLENINTMTGNSAYVNNMTGDSACMNNMAGNSAYGNNMTGNSAYVNNMTGNSAYVNNMTGHSACMNNMACNSAYVNNLTRSGTDINIMTQNSACMNNMTGSRTYMNNITGNRTDINKMTGNITYTNNIPGNITDFNTMPGNLTELNNMPVNTTETEIIAGNTISKNNTPEFTKRSNNMTGNMTVINNMSENTTETETNNMIGNTRNTNNFTGHTEDETNMTEITTETPRSNTYITHITENVKEIKMTENISVTNNRSGNLTDINNMTENETGISNGNETDVNIRTENTSGISNSEACNNDTLVPSSGYNKNAVKKQNNILKVKICRHCNKSFDDKLEYRKHLSVHFQRKEFTCEDCKYCFKKWRDYNIHKCSDYRTRKSEYTCVLCDKVYEESHFNTHMKRKKHPCMVCSVVSCSVKQYTEHKMTHLENKCPSCSGRFASNRGLSHHLTTSHSKLSMSGKTVQSYCVHSKSKLHVDEVNKVDELIKKPLDEIEKGVKATTGANDSEDSVEVVEENIESTIHHDRTVDVSSILEQESERESTNDKTNAERSINISAQEKMVLSCTKPDMEQSEMGKRSNRENYSMSSTPKLQVSANHEESVTIKNAKSTGISKTAKRKFKDNPSKFVVSNSLFCKKSKTSKNIYNKHIHSPIRNKAIVAYNKRKKLKIERLNETSLQKSGKNVISKTDLDKVRKGQINSKLLDNYDDDSKVKDTKVSDIVITDMAIGGESGVKDMDNRDGDAGSQFVSDNLEDDNTKAIDDDSECKDMNDLDNNAGCDIVSGYLENDITKTVGGDSEELDGLGFDNTNSDIKSGNLENENTTFIGDSIENDETENDPYSNENKSVFDDDVDDDVVSDNDSDDSDGYEECTEEEVQAMLTGHNIL